MGKHSFFGIAALPLMTAALACALPSPAAFAAAPPSLYPGQILPRAGDPQLPAGVGQMVTADFNGDGIDDLAQTDFYSTAYTDDDGNQITSGVWVQFGKAGGGYDAPLFYATALNPYGLAAADLNGDGKLDLVVGSAADVVDAPAQLSVLIGNGDGSFQAHKDYTVDGGTSSSAPWIGLVAVGDVTGDGALDVVAVTNSSKIYVVPVNADGTLDTADVQTLTQDSMINNQYNLALADINADGTLDIVTDDTSDINVFYGKAMLATAPDQQVAVDPSSHNIAAGDFNEDGYTDIVESGTGNPAYLQVMLNQGGKLSDPESKHSLPVNVQPWGTISVADVDGDGHLDLFVDDDGCVADSSYLLYGNGDGTFTNPAPVPAGVCGYAAATVAADNGLRNLLTGSWWWDAVVTEARNLGDRKFYTYASYPYATADADGTVHGFLANDMATADFDGDGRPDIVTASAGDGSFSLLLNSGEGGFKAPLVHALPVGGLASIAAADVNGDGKADVLVPGDDGTLYTWLGDGAGGFASPVTSTAASGTVNDIAIGDINGDGKQDAVLAAWGADEAQLCEGDGTGKFTCSDSLFVPQSEGVALVDLNGDGKADLVASSDYDTGSGYITGVFLGDGAGNFTLSAGLATTGVNSDGSPRYDAPRGIAVGDVNGDDKPDIVVGTDGATAYLFEGNGDGTFGSGTAITTDLSESGSPRAVALDDVNGDGVLDIIAGNDSESTVAVVLGNGDGTFKAPLVYASGANNAGVAVADMDGDGQPDIVALNGRANDVVSSTVSVYLHNHAPAVKSLELKTSQDTAVAGTLEVADAEQNGYTLAVATKPAHGTVSGLQANSGAFTYTPAKGYTGADSFTVTASDGMNTSAATAVKVTVQAVAPPDDGSGDNTGGGSDNGSGNDNTPPASSSSGGGGAFGFLSLFALGLPLLRKRRRN
ncbi:MAG TPA: FG-GAP-like repeat-containing protein [Gammaproteobacteria bacterium]|nr:FG-GAP-like repeat-containing protein [Gammaproteobacteria bacterium]